MLFVPFFCLCEKVRYDGLVWEGENKKMEVENEAEKIAED